LAYNYVIALAHNFTAVSGTSASSPVVAGMISLVNSARAAAGKSTLGWANPALYQVYSSFVKDIVEGDNRCAADAMVCCGHGFFATEGWDPVTGLGSIDFPGFKESLVALGNPINIPTMAPSRAPHGPTLQPTTISPSFEPTASPTQSTGWLSITQYEKEMCEGTVTTISAVPSNACLKLYSTSDNTVVGSVNYVCQSEGEKYYKYIVLYYLVLVTLYLMLYVINYRYCHDSILQ
jgi:hypothetical protein